MQEAAGMRQYMSEARQAIEDIHTGAGAEFQNLRATAQELQTAVSGIGGAVGAQQQAIAELRTTALEQQRALDYLIGQVTSSQPPRAAAAAAAYDHFMPGTLGARGRAASAAGHLGAETTNGGGHPGTMSPPPPRGRSGGTP